MNNTHTFSDSEIVEIVHAYHTIQKFLEKFVPLEQIYNQEFIDSINDAMKDVNKKNYVAVNSPQNSF